MAKLYAYAPDAAECASIGLVGALLDRDARFELRAGEFGELSFIHPVDPWGKWEALRDGVVLKAMVPVRLVPEVDDGAYVSSVDEYRVSNAATKYQRYVYYAATAADDPTQEVGRNKRKYQKTRHKRLLKRGAAVTVIGNPRPGDDAYRLKVRVGSGKGKVTGYMEKAGLTLVRQARPVPAAQDGLEAKAPSYALRQQLFRIYEVETEADGGNPGSVAVRARRLVYDLLGNICTYRATANVSCQQACRGILGNTVFSHPFTAYSDIGDRHVGIDARNMNPIEALIDPERGAAARWGGEVVCDDYDIYILRRAGMDRGVTIRYGKDLTGVRCRADSSNVATAICPVGEKANGEPLYLDGHVVNGRCGYNYDSTTQTCASWLPEGFRWALDDDGARKASVIQRDAAWDGYAAPKAAVLAVADAKVTRPGPRTDPSETSVLTAALARVMLAEAAVERFQAGCDLPEVGLEVDFTLLGDTAEYTQYRHLEPLFVYDTVRIRHPKVAVAVRAQLTALTWEVRQERVCAAAFGSPGDAVAKIPGWQISSLSGGKIVPGSVGSGQISAEAIATEHLQAESVNADALQARCITAEKIASGVIDAQMVTAMAAVIQAVQAGTIEAGSLAAQYASLFELAATKIGADFADLDDLTAALANITALTARHGSFDDVTAQNLIGALLTVTRVGARMARIENLYVTQANLMNATLDRLTVLGADGETYYDISVGGDGFLQATVREVSADEAAAGQTDDGRQILDGSGMEAATGADVPDLDGVMFSAMEDGLTWLVTQALSTGKLTATEAFIGTAEIPALRATTLTALGQSLNLMANETIQLLLGTREDITNWFSFTPEGLIIRKTGSSPSKWSTRTSDSGFYIDHEEVAGHVGAFEGDTARFRSLRVSRRDIAGDGDVTVTQTSARGWAWKAE